MKALLTIMTPNITEFCKEFKANHDEYARTRGYTYHCIDTLHWPEHAASFSKIWYIHEALQNPDNEVVIWADADVAFTNMTVDLADLLQPDYWLAGYAQLNNACVGGRPYICAGLMVIRNGEIARKFFEDVMTTEPIWRHDNINNRIHGWEQYYVDEKFVERNFAGVRGCTTAEIGGFSREFWNDKSPWFPGCPTVHISATGNWAGRRNALLKRYLPAVVRQEQNMAIRHGFRRANVVQRLPAPPKVAPGQPLPVVIPTSMPRITKRNQFGRLLTQLGLTGEAVEIGVAEGGFSFNLLDTWPGKLHMVDCWAHLEEGYKDGCNSPTEHQDWRYQEVLKHAEKYGSRAVVHRAFSLDAVELFLPEQLDFAYIDANHAYPAITADLAAWWPKVKKGGIFAGHDYLDGEHGGSDYGVKQAVTEFAERHGLAVHVLPEQWPSWFVRK